jgi:speckle-type POZ protein
MNGKLSEIQYFAVKFTLARSPGPNYAASKRQPTSGPTTEAPAQTTTMNSASAVVEFKVNYEQAMDLPEGKTIHSDAISAGGYMWRINLYFYLRGRRFRIYLELLSKSSVKAIFEVLLIDKDYGQGQPVLLAALRPRKFQKPFGHILMWHISSPDDIDNLIHKYVNDGYIKFLCTIRVLPDNPIPVPPSDIVKHLGTLLDTADGTDVAFAVDGETFHAHRAVLAARSPVFRAELLGRVFFIGRKSPIFPKFPFYPRGPIKFDISQIFPIFPVSTQTIQNQSCDDPTLIMIYSCFDL